MPLLSKLSSEKVTAFAEELADAVAKRYPPALDGAERRKVSVNRLTKILEDAFEKAEAFQKENSLGVYRKAQFGNTFKWRLKELGYSDRFIEVATEGLIVSISRR